MKVPEHLRALVKAAREQGWEVSRTPRGHLRWCSPEGEVVVCGSTPVRGRRNTLNTRAELRRAGLKI